MRLKPFGRGSSQVIEHQICAPTALQKYSDSEMMTFHYLELLSYWHYAVQNACYSRVAAGRQFKGSFPHKPKSPTASSRPKACKFGMESSLNIILMDFPHLVRVLNAIGMQVREVLADSSFQPICRIKMDQIG